MSELLNKVIKRVDLKPEPWHKNNGWYGHIVYFEDGTRGEIFECTEANPPWLQSGKSLVHITRPNKYLDKPYLVTVEKVEQEKREAQQTPSSTPQSNSSNRFQKKGNGGGGYNRGGYGGRLEDSPDIWLQKQKFISILKLYEVLMPLVVKGDIKYGDIQGEVSKHLEFTIKKSGMNEPVIRQEHHIPSHTTIQKPAVKSAPVVAPVSHPVRQVPKEDDRMVHTNRELEPEPNINPEDYSHHEPPTLFEEDTSMGKEPVPADLAEKIKNCPTKAKLLALQRGLTEKQSNNKNIMEAFFEKKNKLGKKK